MVHPREGVKKLKIGAIRRFWFERPAAKMIKSEKKQKRDKKRPWE
jgi:hypothetical protein